MDFIAWAIYAFIAVAAFAATLFHYRRHEPAGRGRHVLAVLRWLAIALLVLLVFDPDVPAAGATGRDATAVLVDASLSMRLTDPDGTSRWDEAVERVTAFDAGRVLLFGGGDARSVTSLDGAGPTAGSSRLAPALRAAAEGGASRVIVITDGALEDATEARRAADESGVAVELVTVGRRTRANVGVTAVRAPAWAEVDEETVVEVDVARVGEGAPDSVTVVLSRDGQDLVRSRVPVPSEGRTSAADLRFTPRAGTRGPVRYDVRLVEGDSEAADDRRSVYVHVAEEPPGVAMISFRPDQEPRFLLPVLERSLGVPTRGWLALRGGRYIRLGFGRDAGQVADESTVRAAVEAADFLVFHGVDSNTPGWAGEAGRAAGRLLVFPAEASASMLPFDVGTERAGDWYPAPDVPSSPVAALIAGTDPGDAPPLTALRDAGDPAGFWTPLNVRLSRRGPARPVLLAGRPEGRRVVVALGEGYWRWALAGGTARALYDRMWSAVAGWLAEEQVTVTDEVRPIRRAVEAASPVRWLVPAGMDSARIVLTPATPGDPDPEAGPGDRAPAPDTPPVGSAALEPTAVDTVVPVVGDTLTIAGMPAGHYRYDVTAFGPVTGDTTSPVGARGDGEITVESFSPELTRSAIPLELGAEGIEAAGERRARGRRPLHATPWPYGLLVLLVCVEWILRRRWGLR